MNAGIAQLPEQRPGKLQEQGSLMVCSDCRSERSASLSGRPERKLQEGLGLWEISGGKDA